MAGGHTALFRVDASRELGGGHVMRCLTLADELGRRGMTSLFVTRAASLSVVPRLGASGHTVMTVDGSEADIRATLTRAGVTAGLAIFDAYDIAVRDETPMRAIAPRIVVIDDLADRRHDCDILIDATVGREPADYAGLVPGDCHLLVGSNFALIRPEFAALRTRSLARRARPAKPHRLLVSLGLTDIGGITVRVVKAIIGTTDDIAIDVVLSNTAQSLDELQALAASHKNISLHIDTAAMAELMANADLAIGAGGQTSLERCVLGLPSIVIPVAENQIAQSLTLSAKGVICVVGNERDMPARLQVALLAIVHDDALRASMSSHGAALCDARGTDRVAQMISALAFGSGNGQDAAGKIVQAWSTTR